MTLAGKVAHLWASGLWTGHLPLAPATWGSLIGLGLGGLLSGYSFWLRLAGFLLALGLSVWAIRVLSPLPTKDPPWFVADENLALLALACVYPYPTLSEALGIFVAFRFWDVVKLWPAEALERLPAPWGIFADDLVAAGYTLLCALLFQLG